MPTDDHIPHPDNNIGRCNERHYDTEECHKKRLEDEDGNLYENGKLPFLQIRTLDKSKTVSHNFKYIFFVSGFISNTGHSGLN